MRIARESWLLAGLCLGDLIFTVWLVERGMAIEANPILRFYLDAGIAWFVAAKMLLSVGPLYVLELVRRSRPRFVQALLRVGIVLYLLCYGIGSWSANGARASDMSFTSAPAPRPVQSTHFQSTHSSF